MTEFRALDLSTEELIADEQDATPQLKFLTDAELACVGGGNLVANF